MADFNGENLPSSPINTSTTMAKLDDDLILEVVARLPLKVAVQCSILNKSLSRLISTPAFAHRAAAHSPSMVFYCSSRNPKIFTRLCRELSSTSTAPPSLSNRDPGASVTLERETLIAASCNGLLLLHFGPMYSHYVLNPTTGGIIFVNFPIDRLVGLAVDFTAEDSHFKLVSLHVRRDSDQTLLTFSLLVPTVQTPFGPSMVLESKVDIAGGAPAKVDDTIQPVYAHGSLFWLGDDGRTTVAFDVEKQQPRIVSGPINENDADRARDRWFGLADGSVHFVCALPEEIVIYGYDHSRDEWGVKYRVATLSNPSNNDYGFGEPLFYDGGRLFFMIRKRGEDGHVYIYHVSRMEWERSWDVAGWSDSKQLFFSFFPTIAKVSGLYLNDMSGPLWPRGTRNASWFRGLMRLLRPLAD